MTEIWQTSESVAQAHVLESSRAQVRMLNGNLTAQYLGRFNDWKISVDAGKISNANPPQPPLGYGFVTDSQGYTFPQENGGGPVCDMPPIPQDRTAAQPEPHSTGNERVQNVPPGDHFPVGFEITAPDGTRWRKTASPTPFGTAYYYAAV